MSDEQKIFEAQFIQLVMGLQGTAWMMLGKTINPVTGKPGKNLVAAKSAIDTLLMLQTKTKGNLSKTEENFLSNTIQQLQLNYVEETKNTNMEPEKKAGESTEEKIIKNLKEKKDESKKESKKQGNFSSKSTEIKKTGDKNG